MKNLTFLILLFQIINVSYEEEEFKGFDEFENIQYNENFGNYINIVSIKYELTYDDYSVLKVVIKTYYDLTNSINFKAYLRSENQGKDYLLNCSNTFLDTIECFSEKNISLNTEDRFYFYYTKDKNDKIIFEEGDTFEDNKRISLIFKPEIKNDQKIFKDNRIIEVNTDNDIINGGYLYLVRKSRKILQKPIDGFNTYMDLNNYIYQNRKRFSYSSYNKAIKKGYHMVEAGIQFTKDKIPVIYYGKNLEHNSSGKGKLSSKTLEELKELDFGYNHKEKGEDILTFEKLLKLCRANNVIIDLDLTYIDFKKYFNNTDEYINILMDLIKKNKMCDSIIFNDERKEVLMKLNKVSKKIAISLPNMNSIENITKIKDEFQDTERVIYNMDKLSKGNKINEDAVKYGLSLDKKIKAGIVDELPFAQKIQSWGVNYITTNSLHPFLIENDKEMPIKIKCFPSEEDQYESVSKCEIDESIQLIDNEIYEIYYSENIYNISENIIEEPIGEFKYINTEILDELYYSIVYFDFEKGILQLNTSNKIKKGKKINGIVGPDYYNVSECYKFNFICEGNNSYTVNCKIQKNEEKKIEYNGEYKIYTLEGYSLNYDEIMKKFNYNKNVKRIFICILSLALIVVIIFGIIYLYQVRRRSRFNEIKISDNAYVSDNYLYR